MLRRIALLGLLASCPGPAPVNEPGGACRTENTATCEAATSRMLQCRGGSWQLYSDCRGPSGCAVKNDTATCDTSGNTIGDTCPPTSEGKVRCEPDAGAHILRCLDGGLTSVFDCPAGTTCGITDAGLSCY